MKHPKTYTDLSRWQKLLFKVFPWLEVRFLKSWLVFYEEDTLPYIYDEITGGMLSYPGYDKMIVLEHYWDEVNKKIENAILDYKEDHK